MIGKKIHNYEIRAHLGEGGMGTVYRATDSVLGRDVALKMLHAPLLQQTQFLERFKKEARLLAQLLHPNIAVIYNLIEQDNNQYMVMEYVEGKNLDALLRQQRTLSYKWVVPVFLQALEGLAHAHKKGIYHRDIKPSNLILTPDGTVKIMDFGIAMMAGEKRMTQVNRVVGTIEYMAPELIEGKDPSMASDIYAIGITMYEMLTGKLPFEGNTDFNLMQDILKKKPVSPDKMNASVPKALNNIVMKALEKKPELRFRDAKEFSNALMQSFPELKYADLSINIQPAPTKIIQVNTKPANVKPTVLQDSIKKSGSRYLETLSKLRVKAFDKENRLYLVAVSVVIIASVTILIIAGSGKKADVLALNQTKVDSASYSKNDREDKNKDVVNGGGGGINDYKIKPLTPEERKILEEKEEGGNNGNKEEGKKEKNENAGKKDAIKKDSESNKTDKVKKEDTKEPEKKEEIIQPGKETEEKKEENENKEEKKREPKTIRIVTAPEVSLYLREPLNPSASEGQTIYFNVTSAVRYNGELIIDRGAVATGRIKNVGNKKISIVISKVKAVNGEMIDLQEAELSGRISDMVSNRNFSVPIKKGITIQL